MDFRRSRWGPGALAIAAVLLVAGPIWAVYYALGPSKDDWGMNFDVEVSAASGDTVNVLFTLADEGRLKPIYAATVVAFSKPYPDGGQAYLAKAEINLKPNRGGKLAGQTQIRKELADRALIRILTLTFDGQRQTAGAKYYDIPLRKFLSRSATAASSQSPQNVGSQPAAKVTK